MHTTQLKTVCHARTASFWLGAGFLLPFSVLHRPAQGAVCTVRIVICASPAWVTALIPSRRPLISILLAPFSLLLRDIVAAPPCSAQSPALRPGRARDFGLALTGLRDGLRFFTAEPMPPQGVPSNPYRPAQIPAGWISLIHPPQNPKTP